MKIILSRKGYDSSTGGCPSPIFPDGGVTSLPIYGIGSSKTYQEVHCAQGCLGTLVESLRGSRARGHEPVHLDPDLDVISLPRVDGWRPAFGQAGTAQAHLENERVGSGDLFLFYGWFRPVASDGNGGWRWASPRRDIHVIFGWLQVAEVLDVDGQGVADILRDRPWLQDHPHLHVPAGEAWGRNVIYVAADTLRLPDANGCMLSGGGVNRRLSERAVLTDSASPNRSLWRLPSWFVGGHGRNRLSCNPNQNKWRRDGSDILLQSVRPQEQVLDLGPAPEAVELAWIQSVIGH